MNPNMQLCPPPSDAKPIDVGEIRPKHIGRVLAHQVMRHLSSPAQELWQVAKTCWLRDFTPYRHPRQEAIYQLILTEQQRERARKAAIRTAVRWIVGMAIVYGIIHLIHHFAE